MRSWLFQIQSQCVGLRSHGHSAFCLSDQCPDQWLCWDSLQAPGSSISEHCKAWRPLQINSPSELGMNWECYCIDRCPHCWGYGKWDDGDPGCTPRPGWVDTITQSWRPESFGGEHKSTQAEVPAAGERERLGCSLRDSVSAPLPGHSHWICLWAPPVQDQCKDHAQSSTAIAGSYTQYGYTI